MATTPEKSAIVSVDPDQLSNSYAGPRTDGTVNKATRLRRLFSFAQIFFLALGYMSSWEAVSLVVPRFINGSFHIDSRFKIPST